MVCHTCCLWHLARDCQSLLDIVPAFAAPVQLAARKVEVWSNLPAKHFQMHIAGDPIETGALRNAVTAPGADTTNQTFTVGAVKSLTGHLEGTAGLAGLMLCMLRLEHHAEPPLRYRNLNPYVEASLAGWHVAHRLPIQAGPAVMSSQSIARAGTSSFSMSGVNAHAIVSQPETMDARRSVTSQWRRDRLFSAALIMEGHPMLTTAIPQVCASKLFYLIE